MSKRLATLLFALICGLALTPSARAHPADINFHNYEITLYLDHIEIVWGILPGPLATEFLWGQVDTNLDTEVSSHEAITWAEDQLELLTTQQNFQRMELTIDQLIWPDSINALRIGEQPVLIFLSADWVSQPIDNSSFEFRNESPNSLHWFAIQTGDQIAFSTPNQNGNLLLFRINPSEGMLDADAQILTEWESGKPEIPGLVASFGLGDLAEQASSSSNRQQGVIGILEGLILNNETSPLFYISAFSLALLLGALHALSPGHGKTIVAAYLVGASGKFYHAIALGSVVTLTHTGSVFALGLATLAASSYLMPASIFPLLEIISGLLIIILGISLLVPRIRDWIKKRTLDQRIDQLIPATEQAAGEGQERLVINQPIEEVGPSHSHTPESGKYIPIPRRPVVGNPLQGISWRSLITLGISGGLVPCPDAIAILLIAVTLNRIGFGLSLIVSFSLGLAVILIIIGLMIVEGRRLFERLRWFNQVAFIMPVISALIVLGLGAVLTVGAAQNLPPGAFANLTLPARAPDWKEMRALYMNTDEKNRYQLFTVSMDGADPLQITTAAEGVSGYSIAPDFSAVIYTINQGALASSIWLWNLDSDEHKLVMDCSPDYCNSPIWPPSGDKLIYERLPNPTDPNALGISSVWWLELDSGETAPLFQDAGFPAFYPKWSTTGDWLSYSSINPNQIRLYHLETGEGLEIPVDGNPQVVWRPARNIILYTEYVLIDDLQMNKLKLFDLETRETRLLSDSNTLDEVLPNWSNTGDQIAVVRRVWIEGLAEIGDQIWLLDPETGEEQQITFEEEIIHGQATWSPDGEALIFHIYNLNNKGNPTEIQVLVLATGEIITIASPGTSPRWIP
ncbi:MAG: hypothetical protein JW757_07115 [Anaerolineales bacterium]|nr:hypothetical protein [Anaerolineales bacterium]